MGLELLNLADLASEGISMKLSSNLKIARPQKLELFSK